MTDYAFFFERRADLCGGEAVLKGTRVTVRTVLASLAKGGSQPGFKACAPSVCEPQALIWAGLRHPKLAKCIKGMRRVYEQTDGSPQIIEW